MTVTSYFVIAIIFLFSFTIVEQNSSIIFVSDEIHLSIFVCFVVAFYFFDMDCFFACVVYILSTSFCLGGQ